MTDYKAYRRNNLWYNIICGDSKFYLTNFKKMDLIIGSPPYTDLRGYDKVTPENYVEWFTGFIKPIYDALSDNGIFVLNINNRVNKGVKLTYSYEILLKLCEYGFHFVDNIIWNKGKMLVSANSKRPSSVYENCFVFAKGLKYTWNPDEVRTAYDPKSIRRMQYKIPRRFSRHNIDSIENKKTWSPNSKGAYPVNIINIGSESKRVSDIHTSVYPVKLVDWFISAFTNPYDSVLDLWLGSGTTIVAAYRSYRNGYGIEIRQDFFDDCVQRIEKEFANELS